MKALKSFSFNQKAITYIRNELSHGWHLAHLLQQILPLESGYVTAFLPATLTDSDVENFDISIYKTVGKNLREEIENQTADDVLAFLANNRRGYFITETLMKEVPHGKNIGDYFSYQGYFYLFRDAPTSIESIRTNFRYCRDYPLISCLTTLRGDLSSQLNVFIQT